MGPNNQTIPDDEIDLREIILTLWKEKYLILIITLVFTVGGYIYGTLKPKVYETSITLRDASAFAFQKYESVLPLQNPKISFASNFNQNFKVNLMSIDNLVNFVKQNKKIDEFKSYLKTNNIETRDYFSYQFQPVTKKKNNLIDQYTLNFSSLLPGAEFLNDYVIFTKQVTVDDFKEQLIESIKNKIEIYNQNLEIAKKNNIETPILRYFTEINQSDDLYYRGSFADLYYRGSKVLFQQKLYLEKMLKETDNYTFDYNPISEKASKPELVTISASISTAIAFALGLFFSFIVIFIRSIFVR